MSRSLLSNLTIPNCYDSHVHWQGTGQIINRLDLSHLKTANDVANLTVRKNDSRGDWLLGYGWDDNLWLDESKPDRKILDKKFPGVPVKFFRTDMHAAWVSTEALKRAGLFYQNIPDPEGGRIEKDLDGWPTGLLIDLAMKPIDNLIPALSASQIHQHLKSGAAQFNRAGFTHVRDMSCDEIEWEQKTLLAESGDLHLAVEQNFHCYSPDGFGAALNLAFAARKNHHPQLRPMGPKIFLDGALGSEGAYISSRYQSGSGRGVLLIERIALKEMMQETWDKNLQLSVHAIGDEAAHIAVTVACELWDMGNTGVLNIEHAQTLRPETIKKMQGRSVQCFMQPCHWLSDRRWLKNKIPDLFQFLFPWNELAASGIHVWFGSDSPIEPTSLGLNIEAIEDAALNGIKPPQNSATFYHQHPDKRWIKDTYTRWVDGRPFEVFFSGKRLDFISSDN